MIRAFTTLIAIVFTMLSSASSAHPERGSFRTIPIGGSCEYIHDRELSLGSVFVENLADELIVFEGKYLNRNWTIQFICNEKGELQSGMYIKRFHNYSEAQEWLNHSERYISSVEGESYRSQYQPGIQTAIWKSTKSTLLMNLFETTWQNRNSWAVTIKRHHVH